VLGDTKIGKETQSYDPYDSEDCKCVGNVRKESPVSRDFVTCKCGSKARVRGASSREDKIRL
jgi:hypothetical protein